MSDYLSPWSGRLRGSLLEMTILYNAAYSTSIYPYLIKKRLDQKWGSFTPPLPTIYSTIKRLEKAGFIATKNEIINSRVQRRIEILDDGWVALEYMQNELQNFLSVFEFHEKEFTVKKGDKNV